MRGTDGAGDFAAEGGMKSRTWIYVTATVFIGSLLGVLLAWRFE